MISIVVLAFIEEVQPKDPSTPSLIALDIYLEESDPGGME